MCPISVSSSLQSVLYNFRAFTGLQLHVYCRVSAVLLTCVLCYLISAYNVQHTFFWLNLMLLSKQSLIKVVYVCAKQVVLVVARRNNQNTGYLFLVRCLSIALILSGLDCNTPELLVELAGLVGLLIPDPIT